MQYYYSKLTTLFFEKLYIFNFKIDYVFFLLDLARETKS